MSILLKFFNAHATTQISFKHFITILSLLPLKNKRSITMIVKSVLSEWYVYLSSCNERGVFEMHLILCFVYRK